MLCTFIFDFKIFCGRYEFVEINVNFITTVCMFNIIFHANKNKMTYYLLSSLGKKLFISLLLHFLPLCILYITDSVLILYVCGVDHIPQEGLWGSEEGSGQVVTFFISLKFIPFLTDSALLGSRDSVSWGKLHGTLMCECDCWIACYHVELLNDDDWKL